MLLTRPTAASGRGGRWAHPDRCCRAAQTRLRGWPCPATTRPLGDEINRDPIAESGGIILYGFVANNPISSYDSLGLCDIKIRCGPVRRSGITLGWHCGVIAPNGVEYGLGGGDQSSGGSGTAHPYPLPSLNPPQPGPANPPTPGRDYPVSCPCKTCDDVQIAIQNYHDTVTPPPYNASGPNSNTYAHNMLNAAGCKVNPIPQDPITIGDPIYGPWPPTTFQPPQTTTPPGTIGW